MAGTPLLSVGTAVACLLGTVSGAKIDSQVGDGKAASTDGSEMPMGQSSVPRHDLIICNGYAHTMGLQVMNMRSEEKITQKPLAYKECADYKPMLKNGDRLDFRAGNTSIGIFRAKGLPTTPDVLLLVPHRRQANSLSAVFESHAFGQVSGAQIAVVDTYRGKESGNIKIMDLDDAPQGQKTSEPRVEKLHFNSVVSPSPGKFQIVLESAGKETAKLPLEVPQGEADFVVVRTGLSFDNNETSDYPMELVVYKHNSGTTAMSLSLLSAALVYLGLTRSL